MEEYKDAIARLIGKKIIGIGYSPENDSWEITLEDKKRLVFDVAPIIEEDYEAPQVRIDIQDYSGGLEP